VPDNTSQNILKTKETSITNIWSPLMRLALLIATDVAAIWFLNKLVSLGYLPLAAVILIITIFVNVVLLLPKAYPIRWMVVGLVLMALFTIYPIFFTMWVSFTNYGEGHLITQEQAAEQILKRNIAQKLEGLTHGQPLSPRMVIMHSGFRMLRAMDI